MREPVTIGDQTFVFDEKTGWMDKKSKIPADKGLLPLLDKLSPETDQETPKKRLRVKIDSSVEPVIIAGQKFVFDVNYGWIDAKTKQKAPENLKNILSFVSPPKKKPEEEDQEAPTNKNAIQALGIVGQVGLEKPTIDSEKEATSVRDKSDVDIGLNRVILKMIEHLASIDATLKAKLKSKKISSSNKAAAQREAVIEQTSDERSQKISEDQKEKIEAQINDAQSKNEEDASPAAKLALATLAIGSIALLYKPITDKIKEYAEGLGTIATTLSSVVEKINGVFEFLLNPLGGAETQTEGGQQSPQNSQQPRSENLESQEGSGEEQPDAQLENSVQPSPETEDGGVDGLFVAGTAAALGTGILSSRIPTPQTTRRVSPPVRPTPQSSPTRSRPVLSRLSQAGRTLATTIARSPVARIAAPVAAVAAIGAIALSGDDEQPATPPQGDATRQRSNAPAGDQRQQDARQENASTVPGVVYTEGNRETGPGWTIQGATDQSGRPVVFSKEGAEAFARMMRDSGGAVKPSDIASSKRSPAKNAAVDGATNSPHLRGVAMDIHGSSNAWIRRNGARYGWSAHDYSGTHGGHFIFGGPGMDPSGPSGIMAEAAMAVEQLTTDAVQSLAKGLSEFISTDTEFRDVNQSTGIANRIAESARQRVAAKVESRSAPPAPSPSPASVVVDRQNANPDRSGTVETIRERNDSVIINQYLEYFHVARPPQAAAAALP